MKSKYLFILIAIFSLAFINSCRPITPINQHETPESRLFLKAEKMFYAKSYKKALIFYNEYMSKFPNSSLAPDVLMREGEIYKDKKDYITARKVYAYLINKYSNSLKVTDAMAEILTILYNEGAYKDIFKQADVFLSHSGLDPKNPRIYLLLGDTYVATNSPVNAVYFYAKANDAADKDNNDIKSRLKNSIILLSPEEIFSLLERVKNEITRGYLMYTLGLKHIDNEHYKEGISTLSQFIDMFPENEYAHEAELLINEAESRSQTLYSGYGQHTIGCLLPLSGAYKIYGNKALKGIEFAIDQLDAKDSITLLVKDTGSDSGQAVKAAEEMIHENVSAIIGPISKAQEAASIAQNSGIPIITLTQKDGIPNIGDYVFRNFLTPKMQVKEIVSYAIETLGLYNFAVLYPDENYGTTFMNLFWEEVASHGGNVVIAEPYGVKQTDFRGPIRKLARYRDFDAIFIPDEARKAGLIIPQLAFYDVKKVPLFGTNIWHSPKLIKMAQNFIQGAVFPEIFFDKTSSIEVQNFIQNFQNTFGESPSFIEAIAYDTAMILLEVFRQPEVRSPKDIKDALMMQLYDFKGITGKTSFDENGEAVKSLYLLKIKNDQFIELYK